MLIYAIDIDRIRQQCAMGDRAKSGGILTLSGISVGCSTVLDIDMVGVVVAQGGYFNQIISSRTCHHIYN